MRNAGNRLRVTAQLIDAVTGNHLWAERYDKDTADIFAVQVEITEGVVASIEPQLLLAESSRSRRQPPTESSTPGALSRGPIEFTLPIWKTGRRSGSWSARSKSTPDTPGRLPSWPSSNTDRLQLVLRGAGRCSRAGPAGGTPGAGARPR